MNSRLARTVLQIFGVLLLFWALLAAIRYFEHDDPSSNIKTTFDALWYSIVTLTTVGYGDYYPHTVGGKVVGIVMVLFSLGFLSYVVGQFTNKLQSYMEKKKLGHFGTTFDKHVVVVGWNRDARLIVDQITHAGHAIVVLTNHRDDIDLLHETYDKEQVFPIFGELDAPETLERAKAGAAASILLNLAEDAEALVYLINLRKKYGDANVVVSLKNAELKDTFYSAGATYVVAEKDISTKLIASFVFEPDVAQFTEDLMTTASGADEFDIFQFQIKEQNPYRDKNCWEAFLDLKKNYNAALIGIAKKEGERQFKLIKNPSEDVSITTGDYLILITDGEAKKSVEERFQTQEGRV